MRNWLYNHSINTHVLLFASIFDEMEIMNFDRNGKVTGSIKVPVKLTRKEKVISQILNNNYQNPNVLRDNENVLPMISIGWKGMQLDTNRMKGMRERRKIYIEYVDGVPRPSQKQHMDMQTVPYILTFEVIAWAKYMDHLAQILENIDTFIHPEIYLEYYEKGLGIGRKILVKKTAENPNFNDEIADNEVRSKFLTWAWQFDVECNLYKPELPVGDPIKTVTVRYSAVTETSRNKGIDLGEQTVSQTVDVSGVSTTGSSGSCFYDYDADLVNYIRKFSDPEYSQIGSDYEPLINCQLSPKDIIPPAVTPVPPFAYGEEPITSDLVTITSPMLQEAPLYVPQAIINTKQGTAPFTIVGFESVVPGSFKVRLSAAPPDNTYSIVWYAFQKYNSQPSE
jgi:hypothetical protein